MPSGGWTSWAIVYWVPEASVSIPRPGADSRPAFTGNGLVISSRPSRERISLTGWSSAAHDRWRSSTCNGPWWRNPSHHATVTHVSGLHAHCVGMTREGRRRAWGQRSRERDPVMGFGRWLRRVVRRGCTVPRVILEWCGHGEVSGCGADSQGEMLHPGSRNDTCWVQPHLTTSR